MHTWYCLFELTYGPHSFFIFILGQFPCLIHGRHVPKDDPSLTFEVLEFLSVDSFWVTLLMLTTFDETRSLSQHWELMGCTLLGLYRLDLSSSLLFEEFQGFVRHSSMSRWQVYINSSLGKGHLVHARDKEYVSSKHIIWHQQCNPDSHAEAQSSSVPSMTRPRAL